MDKRQQVVMQGAYAMFLCGFYVEITKRNEPHLRDRWLMSDFDDFDESSQADALHGKEGMLCT